MPAATSAARTTSVARDGSFAVYVTPRAGRSEIAGEREGAVWVRLAAPPVDGKANAALVELVAKLLGVPKGAVEVVSGASGRTKRVKVTGLSAEVARERLLAVRRA